MAMILTFFQQRYLSTTRMAAKAYWGTMTEHEVALRGKPSQSFRANQA